MPFCIFLRLFASFKSFPVFRHPGFKSFGLLVQENDFKIDLQDGGYGGLLGFQISSILATFDLQVTLILPMKF